MRTPRLTAGLMLAAAVGLAGCSSGTSNGPVSTSAAGTSSIGTPTSSNPTTNPAPPTTPIRTTATPSITSINGATSAPSWLGTRVLRRGPDGFGIAGPTPPELVDRRIITDNLLPPPPDGRFHATVRGVPAAVLARSSWSSGCPVRASQLRYVTVGFRGFDGLAHTGELLVNADAVDALVTVFHRLFDARFPIEQMRIASRADLDAPPTGDGNVTSAFACRPVVGQHTWSQHAYGRAVDVDPFQNPYVAGDTVLPELARAYVNRELLRPGMIEPGGVVVRAFAAVGWGWGGSYKSKKDWMHFSATGG